MQDQGEPVHISDGAACHLAFGGEGYIVPWKRGSSHPWDVARDGAEDRNLRAHSPCVLMPLEEGGQNALQLRGIDLSGNFFRSDSDGVIGQINILGSEDGDIVSVECVYIIPFEVVIVRG